MRVVLVGVGRMGEAILAGLDRRSGHELVVVNRRPERDAELVSRHPQVQALPLARAVPGCDVVLVAVKPYAVAAVLDEAAPLLGPQTVVASVAAGVPLAELARHLPDGQPVARVMPNTPSLVGRGMSAVSVPDDMPDDQVERVRTVMECCGEVLVVPEEQQDAVTAVSGSGPAYVFAVAEAMVEAGVQLGLPRAVATTLATHTIRGAGEMLVSSGEHPSILRENVTSPGGTTAQALKVLDARAVRAAFSEAMTACHDRSVEMGRTYGG